MVALSTLGSFAGLVPPITLGYLINDLVERHGVKPEDALWAALLAGAIVLEAAAYIASDPASRRALYVAITRARHQALLADCRFVS